VWVTAEAARETDKLRHAATLPAAWYRGPDQFELERRAIFAREWLVFARVDECAAAGAYVARMLAGYPLLVVRDEDGVLRGFHNVCRHRAGPLTEDGAGACRGGLVCRYHGWSYRLDGSLLRARDFGDAADFAVEDYGLLPVRVHEWAGLVWVNLDPAADRFVDSLGPFVAEADPFPLASYRFRIGFSEDVACNWKTYVDNYLEGYHIPLVHPGLMREIDTAQYRVDAHDGYCIHSAPARDGARNLGKWMWRWPNLALNLYPDGMNVEQMLPIDASTTRIVYSFFFCDADDETVDATAKVSLNTLAEDRVICEAVQRNLDAGVYDRGRLSPKHEAGVFQFHELVRAALAR
jgi:choline monooxygenase